MGVATTGDQLGNIRETMDLTAKAIERRGDLGLLVGMLVGALALGSASPHLLRTPLTRLPFSVSDQGLCGAKFARQHLADDLRTIGSSKGEEAEWSQEKAEAAHAAAQEASRINGAPRFRKLARRCARCEKCSG
jgi:hypothetical protein